MLLFSAWSTLGSTGNAQEDKLTAKAETGDLEIQVDLSGVFIAEDKDQIMMEPKEYKGDLIITTIQAEGVSVKTGDVLMEFDKKSLAKALEEAEDELSDAAIELKKAKADFEGFQIEKEDTLRRQDKEIAIAQRELAGAKEQAEVDLKQKEKSIDDAKIALEDAKVDLQQLLELYKERELHTKTETILIERERRSVKNQEESLQDTIDEVDRYKKYEHGKDVDTKEIELEKKVAEKKKTEIQFNADQAEKQAAMDKAQRKLDKAQRKVDDLNADQESLRVISPRDGILFYGRTGSDLPAGFIVFDDSENQMRVGGRVRTHDVLLTVAAMENLAIKMRVMENDIQHMETGLPISVIPDAFPNLTLNGELTKVDQIASREGFLSDVREFTVKGNYEGVHEQLRSGMNCRVTVHADKIENAIQIPVVAVFQEGGEYYCFVKKSGKTEKRSIKLGADNGKSVQITEGLEEGETVYLYDPNRE